MNNFPINNNPPQTNQPFKPINLQNPNPKPQPQNPQQPINIQGPVIQSKIQLNPPIAGQGGGPNNGLNIQLPVQLNGQQIGGGQIGQQIKMNPLVNQIGGMQQGGNQQGGLGVQQGIQQGGLGLQQKQGNQLQGNQLINMQKPMISQGGLKPLVDHQILSKEAVNLSKDPEQIIQDLIKFINKPLENEITNILIGIIQLSRDCIDIQLNYISSRFCSITGKNFESDEEILLVQNQIPINGNENDEQYKFDGLFFNIHEFMNRIVINGILDYSLDEIEILLFNGKIKKFCFDTETLHKLFGGEDGLRAKFEEANDYFNGTRFSCPLNQKEYYQGIILTDDRMYSFEAAKELYLEKKSSELFNDQIVEKLKQKKII